MPCRGCGNAVNAAPCDRYADAPDPTHANGAEPDLLIVSRAMGRPAPCRQGNQLSSCTSAAAIVAVPRSRQTGINRMIETERDTGLPTWHHPCNAYR